MDQAQLRELLGEAELRELIDRDALEAVELALQGLDEGRRASSPDRLHDLLLRLGDLTLDELAARVVPGPGGAAATAREWLEALVGESRVIAVRPGGEERFAAAEDAGRLRDALGVAPPPGLPAAFLEPRPRALVEVVSRYARTHGPFNVDELAGRYGLGASALLGALAELQGEGRVLEGEFRPGGSGREWCGAEVLATLRRRSLAALRKQVEPSEPEALGRLLVDWQGVATGSPVPVGPRGARRASRRDRAAAGRGVPRVDPRARPPPGPPAGLPPEDLDTLTAAGEVVWVGRGPLGQRDGRLARSSPTPCRSSCAPAPRPLRALPTTVSASTLAATGRRSSATSCAAAGGGSPGPCSTPCGTWSGPGR